MKRILVAGIGNLFRGDDAFGGEVVRRYSARAIPPGVRAVDFGTNGTGLAYAMGDGYDVVILVDAARRNGTAGSLYLLELDPGAIEVRPAPMETHGIDLPATFRCFRSLGGEFPQLFLIGCEPAELGTDDDGAMGLSEPVLGAVDAAVRQVEALVEAELAGAGRA